MPTPSWAGIDVPKELAPKRSTNIAHVFKGVPIRHTEWIRASKTEKQPAPIDTRAPPPSRVLRHGQ